MKTRSLLITSVLFCALAASAAPSQSGVNQDATDAKQLTSVKQHIQAALKAMGEALPIYGGPRGKSMGAAHSALVLVERTLNPEPSVSKKPVEKKAEKKQEKKPSKPVVVESSASKAESTKTKEEKIADSQAAMAKGQAELEAAAKELETAPTWSKSDQGSNVAKLIQTAIEEAKNSIKVLAKDK